METKFNRNERNYDGGAIESDGGLAVFSHPGKFLGSVDIAGVLDSSEFEQAHFYILKNCDEIQPFLEEFSQIPVDTCKNNSDIEWNRQFISWLKIKVEELHKHDDSKKIKDLHSLSRGPLPYVTSFKGYVTNGYRFHVKDHDIGLRTQNCGVVVVGETDEENKNIDYYGELTEILELQFTGGRRVVLFRSLWFDVFDQERGIKVDKYGFVSVNRQRFLKINEPFVLADQASQVDMNPSKLEKSGMGSTFKTNKHAYIPLGALASRRGKSLKPSGSVRVMAEQRTPIGQSKNFNAFTSYQHEPAQNNILVPPGFDQIEDDVSLSTEVEVMQDTQTNETSTRESEKAKKVRGKNICKNVARLKPGEKLSVTFYQNRAVGKHATSFVRHLGILVRDCNMCPLRVHSWKDNEEDKLEHMWNAVTDKFVCDNMNDQKEHVLQHMRRLWNNWRGSLHNNMKSKPFRDALKDVPREINESDWEWLVKEHFLSDKFKETSTRNSVNRSKLRMPHRTGSKPIRQITYELGGKDGKPPSMDTMFFQTRKKDNKLVELETIAKYAEIQNLVQSDSSLTNIEVVEKCFGPQRKSHVVGFGGGITAKELKGGNSSKAALLDKLNASEKENESLKRRMDELENKCERMDELESKYERLASAVFGQPSSPSSSNDR